MPADHTDVYRKPRSSCLRQAITRSEIAEWHHDIACAGRRPRASGLLCFWGMASPKYITAALLLGISVTLSGCGVMRSVRGGSMPPRQPQRQTDRPNTHARVPSAANPVGPAQPIQPGKRDSHNAAGERPIQQGEEAGPSGTSAQQQRPTGTGSPWTITTITQAPPSLSAQARPSLSPQARPPDSVTPDRRPPWGLIVATITLSLIGLGALAWVRSRRRLPG
jgi:hypothetical protein